ncbi:hypothetical protein Q3G72_006820 [Acer saccharum]|nr:hypothetical protein Q3G72_006820 [Acer saccharum]
MADKAGQALKRQKKKAVKFLFIIFYRAGLAHASHLIICVVLIFMFVADRPTGDFAEFVKKTSSLLLEFPILLHFVTRFCNGSGGCDHRFSCDGGWPIIVWLLSKHQELHQLPIKSQGS